MTEQDEKGTLRRKWQFYKYRRSLRRANVSRALANAYRCQTDRLLEQYPEAEAMTFPEWLREFASHLVFSAKGRLRYRVADARSLLDVVRATVHR